MRLQLNRRVEHERNEREPRIIVVEVVDRPGSPERGAFSHRRGVVLDETSDEGGRLVQFIHR
jgi:hypothetical protein